MIATDGRHLVGTLRGVDKWVNLALGDAEERVYSRDERVRVVPLGAFVLRGDSFAAVGTVDAEALDAAAAASEDATMVDPIKPVVH